MAKLPSIQGLRDGQTITVRFEQPLFQYIESKCRAEWLELHRLDHPNDNASPFVPYNEFMQTREGNVHMELINVMFYVPNSDMGYPIKPYAVPLSVNDLNMAMSRVQAKRYNTQGTRRRFEKRVHSATDYRKFRNWWINKNYAEALGVEFSVPCPFKPFEQSGPTESYIEIGEHFEEWTGHKIPKEMWTELKRREAERLAHNVEKQAA